ncbi:hypothetical protein [Lysobacter enzymogenes]|uniref:hypothetical protein n=1 Tax=Lysobacter enzymogenes TaxID=69 RepID=UPI001113D022|nr:hypothetical protein [Lysobacter enzymogenes]
MAELKCYWFKFEMFSQPTSLNIGCGVTAHDYSDAIGLLRSKVFDGNDFVVLNFHEDVKLSELDQSHVVPNMGVITSRGIWFPLGYD